MHASSAENHGSAAATPSVVAILRVNWKAAPGPAFDTAQRRPPWFSLFVKTEDGTILRTFNISSQGILSLDIHNLSDRSSL